MTVVVLVLVMMMKMMMVHWTDARSSVTHQLYDRCYHLIAGVDVAIS